MSDKQSCERCVYSGLDCCEFPRPQDGSDPPFMVMAVMPDPYDNGKNCMHFRARHGGNDE